MKRKLTALLLLFIGTATATEARQLRFYADLINTEDFSEMHSVSSVDSLTPGGSGNFVWVANDLRPGLWGIRFKSSQSGKAGSWVRQFTSPVNADWFGARHMSQNLAGLTPTFKNLGYEETEIRNRFSIFIPEISMEDTPDWAALRMCMIAMENGYYSMTFGSADFYINRTITLPEKIKPGDFTSFTIDGAGCTVFSINNNGYAFFESLPDNQQEGLDLFTARRFSISNLILRGRALPGKGSVGIRIGATFHSKIENVHLADLDTGIVLRHAMSTEIYRCNSVNCFSVGYYLGSGEGVWPGADAPNSGSNQSRVIASRVFVSPGQSAGVYISNSSECRVTDLALDGGLERSIDYAVYINTGGTTTVKDGYIKGIHGESGINKALAKFRGDGNAVFVMEDIFVQMKCVIAELEVISGYAQLNCNNFSYFHPGSLFANKGNGGAWSFTNVFERNAEVRWKTGAGYSLPIPERIRNIRKLM